MAMIAIGSDVHTQR